MQECGALLVPKSWLCTKGVCPAELVQAVLRVLVSGGLTKKTLEVSTTPYVTGRSTLTEQSRGV